MSSTEFGKNSFDSHNSIVVLFVIVSKNTYFVHIQCQCAKSSIKCVIVEESVNSNSGFVGGDLVVMISDDWFMVMGLMMILSIPYLIVLGQYHWELPGSSPMSFGHDRQSEMQTHRFGFSKVIRIQVSAVNEQRERKMCPKQSKTYFF